MSYMTNGLSFNTLREANKRRLPEFKNSLGQPAHSKPDGSDWSPAQWLQAVVGELGEYANLRKKYERGDIPESQFLREAGRELADVQTYLDILANQIGIDLGQATKMKFNEVSERVGSRVYIGDDDEWHLKDTISVDDVVAKASAVAREMDIDRKNLSTEEFLKKYT
jgi:NTP pyrophosphatase (non-canonical NTP hydrolase)